MNINTSGIKFCVLAMVPLISNLSFGADYWITKTGNDQNGCTNNVTDACLTIQKGISLAGPGDTVNVGEGTYIENSAISPYTSECIWLDGDPVSLCINRDGMPSSPITLKPASSAEGKVIIDSELSRVGLQIQNHDYIRIQGLTFINNNIAAIASWGQPENRIADMSRLSIGVIIEDNYIYNTNGIQGKNIAGIHMWGSKDWVIRNNYIDYITKENVLSPSHTSGIQAYGTINALIEHNHIVNVGGGVLWKDHFVADEAGTPIFESEIRYNIFATYVSGINITAMGSDTDEAGRNFIHHNIFYNFSQSAINANISHALSVSTGLRIEHNIIDGSNVSQTTGVLNDAYVENTMLGNIIVRTQDDIMMAKERENWAKLSSSDYNVFEKNSVQIGMDRYSASYRSYKSLVDWQSASSADTSSLNTNNPDQNSIEVPSSSLFVDIDTRNYQHAVNSPALRHMSDGTHAGAYQYGTEIIGNLPNGYSRPQPPQNILVK